MYSDRECLKRSARLKSLCMSCVVLQELLVRIPRSEYKEKCDEFNNKFESGLAHVPDSKDWILVGRCLNQLLQDTRRGKLSKDGVNLLVRDALIARGAIVLGATLVTFNMRDFEKIKRVFRTLKLQSPDEFFELRGR